MHLIDLADLQPHDIHRIWSLVTAQGPALQGTVGWSFEGTGTRTRTSFLAAFRQLGLAWTELPGLLKTAERVSDLAAYLDPFYTLYVVREADHARLAAFAAASQRPVINAMSAQAHPCEVLTDAHYIHTRIAPLARARICLWGASTNVFRSWHGLAQVLGLTIMQVCHPRHHQALPQVRFATPEALPGPVDVVITDAAPAGAGDDLTPLTRTHLAALGDPALLPTPPFTVGGELALDPTTYPGFVGHAQKALLLPVQAAIIRWALASDTAAPSTAAVPDTDR